MSAAGAISVRSPLPIAAATPEGAGRSGTRGAIPRPRIGRLLAGAWRVAVLVAPPGWGKSVAARQWLEGSSPCVTATAGLTIEGISDEHACARLLDAVASLFPIVRGAPFRSAAALVGAVRRLDRCPSAVALLVDCPQPLATPSVWEVLGELIEGLDGRLRTLVTAHVDPPLPDARRPDGTIRIVRENDLRFDDREAIEVAASLGRDLAAELVVDINRWVEGWPLAFTLAALAAEEGSTIGRLHSELCIDVLVAAVVDELDPRQRAVATDLAALEWFDDALAVAVAGPAARSVADELRRRHLVEPTESGTGVRFHGLVRALLGAEMTWRDPQRHAALQQRAARHLLRQGRWESACCHLGSRHDRPAVHDLVVKPALALADRGDRAGLRRVVAGLPRPSEIDNPAVALDLAMAAFFAGERRTAQRWADRAAGCAADHDPIVARVHSTRALLSLMDGEFAAAAHHADRFSAARTAESPADPLGDRFALVGARLALLRLDVVAAQRWIDDLNERVNPPMVADVTIPALQIWHDSLVGLTHRSLAAATATLERVEAIGCGAHHDTFEAFVASAWAHLRAGHLAEAERLAAVARNHAGRLGYDWNAVHAAEISAHVHLAFHRWSDALAAVTACRSKLTVPGSDLARRLRTPEAAALWRLGRVGAAIELLDPDLARPQARLLRAAIAVEHGDDELVSRLLGDTDAWLWPDRVHAALLVAVAGGDEAALDALVEDAAALGLLWPFLVQGRRVENAVLGLPLERLHPALIVHLRSADRAGIHTGATGTLTGREVSILALLPSHLTYADIAERLTLSVNTVKSNLKSIYRKLGVSGRGAAVAVARAHGLV